MSAPPSSSGSWVASILANSPLALVICGSALFITAATGGVLPLSIVLSELPWRIAVAVLGVGLIVSGAVVGYLARRTSFRQAHAPQEHVVPLPLAQCLRLPFVARRAELTKTQRELLDYVEQETRKRASISQQELEGRFPFEVYWRLETLCLLSAGHRIVFLEFPTDNGQAS